MRRKQVKKEDLPKAGPYIIYPKVEELAEKTVTELKKIKNFIVENDYGKIKFK